MPQGEISIGFVEENIWGDGGASGEWRVESVEE